VTVIGKNVISVAARVPEVDTVVTPVAVEATDSSDTRSEACPIYVMLHVPDVVPWREQPYSAVRPLTAADAWTVVEPAVTVIGSVYPHSSVATPGAHWTARVWSPLLCGKVSSGSASI
jgi:hypothetical protein